jgi:SAM-dependent methyltransferase
MWKVAGATPKNFLVHAILQSHLRGVAERHVRGDLIDIGCGRKPYARLLASFVRRHVGVDHPGSLHGKEGLDVLATAYALPVQEASFDSAFCTAVLEHLEEPEDAIRECRRVLKEGGVAVYSVPFIWHLHEEPRDFYRFSPHGLRYLFEKTGFQVLELTPLSGFWVTFGQLLVYNLHRLNRGPLRWLRVIDLLGLLVQGVAWILDRVDRTKRWSWMHVIVARR